jgi:hypothetical protein
MKLGTSFGWSLTGGDRRCSYWLSNQLVDHLLHGEVANMRNDLDGEQAEFRVIQLRVLWHKCT